MELIFQALNDRTRASLSLDRTKMIFGSRKRPCRRKRLFAFLCGQELRLGSHPCVALSSSRQLDCKAFEGDLIHSGRKAINPRGFGYGVPRGKRATSVILRCPRMNENELFQAALGLLPPWKVDRCTFDEAAGRLDIHLDFPRGSVFACPVCGTPRVAVPWARPDSGFTLLFEALVVM